MEMKYREQECRRKNHNLYLLLVHASYIIPSARDPNIPQENFRFDNSFRKVAEYKCSFYFFLILYCLMKMKTLKLVLYLTLL